VCELLKINENSSYEQYELEIKNNFHSMRDLYGVNEEDEDAKKVREF
jgi:hypothetical protein